MKVIAIKYRKNGESVLTSGVESAAQSDGGERQNRSSERERRLENVRLYAARFDEGKPIFNE